MDLRSWIGGDLDSLQNRLSNGIFSVIPHDRLTERVDDGGIAALYVTWHTARHQDLSVNGVLRGTPEVLDSWSERVGLDGDSIGSMACGKESQHVLSCLGGVGPWLQPSW